MAWNRSSNSQQTETALRRGQSPRPTVARGVIAGLVIAFGAAVAAWWLWPEAATRQDDASTRRGLIKEVSPAKAAKVASAPEKKKDPPGYYNGKKISESNRPPWMSPYHRIIDYGPTHTNEPPEKTIYEKVFPQPCDQQIAEMLDTEPGTEFIGDCSGLYKNFQKSFVKSLTDPIIVFENDSDEVKQLKRAVIDARIELKDRLDRGEDLQKVMEENWNAMRELGLYKEELTKQLSDICRDNLVTEQEVEDYVQAANRMLKERGCAELPLDGALKRQLLNKSRAHDRMRKMKEGQK